MCSTRKRKVLVAIVLQNTLGVLRSFGIFTGKRLCWNLFSSKVTGSRAASLLKKRPQHKSFPVNIAKFSKTAFFMEHLQGLLLFVLLRLPPMPLFLTLTPLFPMLIFIPPENIRKSYGFLMFSGGTQM